MANMTVIRFECKHCNQTIKAAAEHAGKKARCPSCKKSVLIPAESEDNPLGDDMTLAAMSLIDDVNLDEFEAYLVPSKKSRPSETPVSQPSYDRAPPPSNPLPANPPSRESFRAPAESGGSDLPSGRNHPVLLRVSAALRLLGVITTAAWVFMSAAVYLGLDSDKPTTGFTLKLGFWLIGGSASTCLLWGFSELIKVVLEIHANTVALAGRSRRS